MGEDALAHLPRRHLRHDAARRGIRLHPPRYPHRARRLHGAHPRHQVPHPAAVGGRRRRRGRLLPVGIAAAVRVGAGGRPTPRWATSSRPATTSCCGSRANCTRTSTSGAPRTSSASACTST
jgi:hypothetical protein